MSKVINAEGTEYSQVKVVNEVTLRCGWWLLGCNLADPTIVMYD